MMLALGVVALDGVDLHHAYAGQPSSPDLVVSSVTNPPSTAVAGGSFSVTDTTGNSGNATTGASTTRYRLSTDNTITSADTLLTGTRSIPSLNKGASSSGTVAVTIPPALAPGTYYLGACADDLGVVVESSETNNCRASSTTVVVSAAPSISNLTPNSGPIGTSVTISGANFGATQGSSTITFNGTPATPTSWSNTSIAAPVPSGATSGPVVVSVGGVSSNGMQFTLLSLSEIAYIYDSLGRLKAVSDLGGDTAIYNYDAVGNLLSITRQASSVVSVIEFTPGGGPVGTVVTIFGTGFSATASQNTVTFNGVAASVTSATTTKIVTTLPVGATTGFIGVTSPSGSAASSSVFTVTSSTGAPTITGFTPSIGTPGTAVTVTGTNFSTSLGGNDTRFNIARSTVSSATATSIATTVPSGTGSGRISVTTAKGKGTSNADFFIPPSPFTANDVEYTGRMSIDGSSHTATITTPNKIGLVVFDGTAGQTVSLGINSTTLSFWSDLNVYKPDGSALVSNTAFSTDTNNHMVLPMTGTYTILIDPDSTSTGSVTLTLSSELNAGTVLVDGASATATISRVGQRARMTFDGTAGQIVSLGINSTTLQFWSTLTVYKPDGSALVSNNSISTDTNNHMVLPVTGTYSILIDPGNISTGSLTLTLSSELNAGTVVVDGASASAAIGRVGQRARMTFDGTAGQTVSLGINSTTLQFWSTLTVYKPDGSVLVSNNSITTDTNNHMVLPVTGTYSIVIDPGSTSTGSATLTLSSEINGGSLTINGASAPITISRVGQRTRLTFAGTASQQATVRLTSNSMGTVTVSLFKPDGSQLTASTSSAGSFNLSTQTLPTSGTYTILVDPASTNTGSINVAVTSP